MNLHDTLYRYTLLVEQGFADTDLTDDERAHVVSMLRQSIAILSQFGGTSRRDLARMMRDPMGASDVVNSRVQSIIENV